MDHHRSATCVTVAETTATRAQRMAHHAHALHTHSSSSSSSSSSRLPTPSMAHSTHMLHAHSSSSSKRMTPVQRGMADAAAARRRHVAAFQPPAYRASLRAASPPRVAVSNSTYGLTSMPHGYASDTFWSEPIPDAPPYRRLVERLLAPLGRMLHRA